jgi:hypothetical protein
MNVIVGKDMSVAVDLVAFGRDRLCFHRKPSWEEWGQLMVFLKTARSTSLRWIADARLVGRREFGDEMVQGFEVQLDLDLPDLKAASALEALEYRSEDLSDEHHFVVASKVKDEGERREWLERAQRENLSAADLKLSISSGRVMRKADIPTRSAGLATIEGVAQLFSLWHRQVPDEVWQEWPEERLEKLREALSEIGGVWDALNGRGNGEER